MKKKLYTIILSILCVSGYANIINVDSQTDWNLISSPIISSDTIIIAEGVVITNTGALDIQGTIINYGDFTMNGTGIGVNMMGMIHNYGSWTVGNVGLSIIDGIFINIGMLLVQNAAIVVQPNGILYNLGTITNNVDIAIIGEYQNCGTVENNQVRDAGGTLGSTVPAGTPCNDLDDNTEDDVTIDDACTCEGIPLPAVPTLSQWALIMLSFFLLIIGLITIRNKKVAFS